VNLRILKPAYFHVIVKNIVVKNRGTMFNINIHGMLVIQPPHGTQFLGNADGSYMLIYARSEKESIKKFLDSLIKQLDNLPQPIIPSAAISEPAKTGTVIKGDVSFQMVPNKPIDESSNKPPTIAEEMRELHKKEKLDETILQELNEHGTSI
jgi:hypothetical protein